ncbi:MAG: thiamine pyrophosphate-dependent enzyme, partial [Phycisphaerales bacterium]|nr:thiamine pyrophosphate-dependent enzyme [Phycisphaerales bacterium]
GASISLASGIARTTSQRTVAYIGDSTFFHSGLPALVNALQAEDKITVVILNNYITAMTGFQPSPTTGKERLKRPAPNDSPTSADGNGRFSIEEAVRGLGVREIYSVDPFDEQATLAALKQAKRGKGVNVVICHSPCVVHERRTTRLGKRAPYEISQEQCNACSLCVRVLGCPAILTDDGKYWIDGDLCDGCDLCARLCQQDAIHPVTSEQAP